MTTSEPSRAQLVSQALNLLEKARAKSAAAVRMELLQMARESGERKQTA